MPNQSPAKQDQEANAHRDRLLQRAITSPIGYGYPGRIVTGVSAINIAQVDTRVKHCVSEGKPVPTEIQLDYLLSHGYYDLSELMRRKSWVDYAKKVHNSKGITLYGHCTRSDKALARLHELGDKFIERDIQMSKELKVRGDLYMAPLKDISFSDVLEMLEELNKGFEAELEEQRGCES